MIDEKYLYNDTIDKYASRKRELQIYVTTYLILYIFVLLLWILAIVLNSNSKWFNLIIISFFIILIVGLLSIFYGINAHKKSINEGISLTKKYLNLYGEKIKISDIIYVEVVNFLGSGGISSIDNPNMDNLLIIFIRNKNRKIRKKIIRYDETTDIFQLSNLIRSLVGLPKQYDIKKYSNYREYLKWKKEMIRKIENSLGKNKNKNLK